MNQRLIRQLLLLIGVSNEIFLFIMNFVVFIFSGICASTGLSITNTINFFSIKMFTNTRGIGTE